MTLRIPRRSRELKSYLITNKKVNNIIENNMKKVEEQVNVVLFWHNNLKFELKVTELKTKLREKFVAYN